MATTAYGVLSGPDSGRTKYGPEEKFQAAAQAQFGSINYGAIFNDFLLPNSHWGWTQTIEAGSPGTTQFDPSTASTSDPLETSASGFINLYTQAAAGNSGVKINAIAAPIYPSGVYGGAYSWRMSTRFRMQNAMASTTVAGIGFLDNLGGKTLMFGFNGGLSTTQFTCQYGGIYTGSSFNIGAVDTAWHKLDAWVNAGGNLNVAFDGTIITPQAIAWASHYSYFSPIIRIADTAGGTIRGLKVDYLGVASPAPGR